MIQDGKITADRLSTRGSTHYCSATREYCLATAVTCFLPLVALPPRRSLGAPSMAARLRHHASAVVATAAAAAADPLPHSHIVAMRELYERQHGVGPPEPLAVAPDGSLEPATIERLRDGIAAAVARNDFLEAERLHRALVVLGPRAQPLRWEDCAPLSLPQQVDFFEENG